MLTEIEVGNEDETFYPGTFVRVSMQVATPPALTVPADALVFREGAAQSLGSWTAVRRSPRSTSAGRTGRASASVLASSTATSSSCTPATRSSKGQRFG